MTSFIRKHIQSWDAYTPGEQPQTSPARQKRPQEELPQAQKQVQVQPPSRKIIKLNTNESPVVPSFVKEQFHTWSEALARKEFRPQLYPDPETKALKHAASTVWALPPEHFVFGNGSDELIAAVMRAFVEREDPILLPVPTYGAYAITARLYERMIIEIPIAFSMPNSSRSTQSSPPASSSKDAIPAETAREQELLEKKEKNLTNSQTKNLTLSTDALETLAKAEGKKVVFLPNPHSPSGSVMAKETLLDIIRSHPRKLFIIDEAYADFCEETLIPVVPDTPNLIVLRTFSKAVGLAGLRLGYAVASPEHAQALRKVLDPYNLNSLTQSLAVTAFEHYAEVSLTAQKICKTRDHFVSAIGKLGFVTHPSAANFILTAPKDFVLKAFPNAPFHERAGHLKDLLKAAGILVRHFSDPDLACYLRISIGSDEEMQTLLKELMTLQA